MTHQEADLLLRLSSALSDIPLPKLGGTGSANPTGLATYAFDMAEIKKPLRQAFYHLRIGELDEAAEIASDIEKFIAARQRESWRLTKRTSFVRDAG